MIYCCGALRHYCTALCTHRQYHQGRLNCPETVIHVYGSGQLGLPVHDDGNTFIKINFCPFCGERFDPERKESAHDEFINENT